MERIFFIIGFSTKASEYENQPRPRFCWTRPDGKMIGIWGLEWGEILMKAVADHCPDYFCEVWQPELGADKVYSAELQPRLTSRKFPAVMKKHFKLYRYFEHLYSEAILKQVRESDSEDTVFMLPVSRRSFWFKDLIDSVVKGRILYYNFLNSSLLLPHPLRMTNPLKAAGIWMLNREKARSLNRVGNLLTMNDNPQALASLQALYPGLKIFYFMWGYDLDYWKPVMSGAEARKSLGITAERFVIVLSQRLSEEYQVDKIIATLAKLKVKRDFVCFITGHGLYSYEQYLLDLVERLQLQDRVSFVGFVDDETLRKYFIAADLFVNLPVNSAGSASALKATMAGTPVLLIPTGALYEFLRENKAGEFVDPLDPDAWVDKFQQIIDGRIQVKVPSRQAMAECFSWESNIKNLRYAIENAK